MKKHRDWMDYLNTGANVMQTVQLSGVRSQLAGLQSQLALLTAMESNRDRQVQTLRLWRQFLIDHDNKLDTALKGVEATPKAAYAIARIMQRRFEVEKFSPSVFDDWADIDRAKVALKKLDKVLAATGPRVGESFQKEVEDCTRFAEEMSDLNDLIRLLETNEKRAASERRVVEIETELRTSLPATVFVLQLLQYSFAIICVVGAVGGCIALENSPPNKIRDDSHDTAIFLSLLGCAVLSPLCGVVADAILKKFAPKHGILTTELKLLKQVLENRQEDEHDVLKVLLKIFGDGPSSKFIQIREERTRRWDALFEADAPVKFVDPDTKYMPPEERSKP